MTHFNVTNENDNNNRYMLYLNQWFSDILKRVEYITKASNLETKNLYRSVLQRSLIEFFNELAYLEIGCQYSSDSSTDTAETQTVATPQKRETRSTATDNDGTNRGDSSRRIG